MSADSSPDKSTLDKNQPAAASPAPILPESRWARAALAFALVAAVGTLSAAAVGGSQDDKAANSKDNAAKPTAVPQSPEPQTGLCDAGLVPCVGGQGGPLQQGSVGSYNEQTREQALRAFEAQQAARDADRRRRAGNRQNPYGRRPNAPSLY